jgi:hypothetical protein
MTLVVVTRLASSSSKTLQSIARKPILQAVPQCLVSMTAAGTIRSIDEWDALRYHRGGPSAPPHLSLADAEKI